MTTPTPHSCGRCDARWSGTNVAHCSLCHTTFRSPSGFDRHRRGDLCITPETLDFVATERHGLTLWGHRVDTDALERLKRLP